MLDLVRDFNVKTFLVSSQYSDPPEGIDKSI